jgi:arsenite-transporting ATPase
LRRAEIEPYAWVINNTLVATDTTDPLLRERAKAELAQIREVEQKHARRVVIAPLMITEPTGTEQLQRLARTGTAAQAAYEN